MSTTTNRRTFMKHTAAGAAAFALGGQALAAPKRQYGISLAGWSLHRTIGRKGKPGTVPMVDMPKFTRDSWDIEAIELVSGMLPSTEKSWRDELAKNAAAAKVKILLIMIDGQGAIGDKKKDRCADAVRRHMDWIDYAADFGCHSVRMNWSGAAKGTEKDPAELADFVARSVPGFTALCEYGELRDINVIIENHGGPSSYPDAMDKLMAAVDHPRFGTLPDFGNFPADVDIYEGIDRLMPYAKALSAKCYDFDAQTGKHTDKDRKMVDFEKMLQICVDKYKYNGYIGIEYEGKIMNEVDGIAAANKRLIELRG
jgi:L-ribulose-5-phosphate 3-epimerase